MGERMKEINTSRTVLDALNRAAMTKPSASQVREQRVSFVMASVSEKSGVTRERVMEIIRAHEGND